MPTPCYISIYGKTQGSITTNALTSASVGNSYVNGHDNEILAQEVEHQVTVPTDQQSGQPSGQRRHEALVFTTQLNRAIPLLYNSLSSGELLEKVSLKWYRTSTEGKQEHFFTTELTDAVAVNINCEMPHCQDQENAAYTQLVEVALSYRKIVWTHETSGTIGADDWRKPLV